MTEAQYSPCHGWLQPQSIGAGQTLCVSAGDGCLYGAEELVRGMTRLGYAVADGGWPVRLSMDAALPPEAYSLSGGQEGYTVQGGNAAGVLYGVYELLRRMAQGEKQTEICFEGKPSVAYRMLNHWDNMTGDVERGYAGGSLFFADGEFSYDPKRIADYGRLLASVGINAIAINNVNVTKRSAGLIAQPLLGQVAALAGILRPFGVRLALSVHFDSPVLLGGLDTPDPLDPAVGDFWARRAAEIYAVIPDFLGFVVKADSEFRGGPEALGRTQADGANTLARALAPHGGMVFWRCFVYNCKQDWRDRHTDRPKAAYEHFQQLDGAFDHNVVLQIKYGPLDFQAREPLSPLFAGLTRTRQAVEYQITQEYTGHQIDLYTHAVQWRGLLDSPVDAGITLADEYGKRIQAVCAVPNVGNDPNWTGNTLAQCNLYAFGRMAWDPRLDPAAVVEEWVKQTFAGYDEAQGVVKAMLLRANDAYEAYTAPLGIGFMVNPHGHYGPNVEGYEFAKWGTYHRADRTAIGVDRTSRGTGYTLQYPAAIRQRFDDPATCPQHVLLFFHRLPYDYRMPDGRSLLQYIYDTHYEGAQAADALLTDWESLEGILPRGVYVSVRERLLLQVDNAREWRDVINTYFYRKTGIPDAQGRTIYP